MLDRIVNILLIFCLIGVFILVADANDHIRVIIALLLSVTFSFTTFYVNWLTLDGAVAASVFGCIALGLGGIPGAVVVLLFFISGSLLSKDLAPKRGSTVRKFRRTGLQVWANGFWFAIGIILWFITVHEAFLIAAVAAMAAATADTWATEIGGARIQGKTRLLTTWKKVEPGTDGGVSFAGTCASVFGAMVIAAGFYFSKSGVVKSDVLIIIISAVAGSLMDSYFGARFQDNVYALGSTEEGDQRSYSVDNNMVNWMSTGVALAAGLIFKFIV